MTHIRSIRRLLRRKTHFVSDMYARDMLYALTVRSDHARGRLISIRLPEQYSHLRLITAHDIPGSNQLNVYGDSMPVLAFDEVRYIGEPLALLVGADLSELNTALDFVEPVWDETYTEQPQFELVRPAPEQIALELKHSFGEVPKELRSEATPASAGAPAELPSVAGEAAVPAKASIYPSAGAAVADTAVPAETEQSGTALTESSTDEPASDTQQANSTEGPIYSHHSTGAQEHLYNEPQGAFCVKEDKTRLVVYSATQWPFLLRDSVCRVLDIPARSCVVRSADIGTSLDGKLWYPALTAAHAALACHLTGKPLKIMYSREEDFRFSTKRAPTHIRYATTVDENGEIESMDLTVHVAFGAYGVFTHEILTRTARAAVGRYRLKNLRITARAVRTNLPPANVLAGFGDGAGSFALESHIARLVARTEFLPSSWRAANLLTRGERDFTGTPLESDADSGRVIERVAANADFNRKHAAFELQKKRRTRPDEPGIRARGIGIAFASSVDGFLDHGEAASLSSTVKVRLDSESKGTIFTSAVAENSSIHQHWSHSVAEILGISEVEIADVDTDLAPDSGPSTLSRNTAVIAKLIESCANTIKKRRFRDPLPLEARKTVKAAKGKKSSPNWSKALGAPGDATAACVVEVELEPATLTTRIRGIWLCVEAGRILDLEQARKSIEAGVAQSLGWTTEEVLEYIDGAITPDGYELYKPGRAPTRDRLHIEFVQMSGKRAPHGIESLAGLVVPAAYTAATAQAGAPQLNAIPCGPSVLVGRMEGP